MITFFKFSISEPILVVWFDASEAQRPVSVIYSLLLAEKQVYFFEPRSSHF